MGDADLNLLAAGVPLFARLGLRPRSWLALRETGVPRSREVDRDLQGKTDFRVRIRGRPYSVHAVFWPFLTPSPPLSAMCLHLHDPPYKYVRYSITPPQKKEDQHSKVHFLKTVVTVLVFFLYFKQKYSC